MHLLQGYFLLEQNESIPPFRIPWAPILCAHKKKLPEKSEAFSLFQSRPVLMLFCERLCRRKHAFSLNRTRPHTAKTGNREKE